MKMTLEQHRELGEQIRFFRNILMQKHVLCVGTKSSRESRAVANAIISIERMRNRLDNVVCRDFQECDGRDLNSIYYGGSAACNTNQRGQRQPMTTKTLAPPLPAPAAGSAHYEISSTMKSGAIGPDLCAAGDLQFVLAHARMAIESGVPVTLKRLDTPNAPGSATTGVQP